ncbi:MAG TPA: HAD-IA family hydrolase [Thermoplasmata archaeon]|nr:HAD-IA family hydrolase [Thermoplasmata archaeon]
MNSRPPVRALLIDLGGVVVRDPRPIVLRMLGPSLRDDPSRLKESYYQLSLDLDSGSIDMREMYGRLQRRFRLDVPYPRFRAWLTDRSLTLYPGVVRAVQRLKSRGAVRIVFASNVSMPVWRALKRKFRLDRLADEAALSCQLGVLKPDPRFYRAALRLARTERQAVLYVDDVRSNVLAARRLGIRSVWVRGPRSTLRALRQLAAEPRSSRTPSG